MERFFFCFFSSRVTRPGTFRFQHLIYILNQVNCTEQVALAYRLLCMFWTDIYIERRNVPASAAAENKTHLQRGGMYFSLGMDV